MYNVHKALQQVYIRHIYSILQSQAQNVGKILQQSYWLQLEYFESSLEREIGTFSGDRLILWGGYATKGNVICSWS